MRRLVVAALIISAAGCAVAPPKFSETDVAQARQFDQAQSLYRQLQAELAAEPSSSNAESYRSMVSRLGSRLATLRTEAVRERIDEKRLHNGVVPLEALDLIAPEVAEMRPWDADVWRMVAGEIESERERTETALDRARARLASVSPERDPVGWVESLDRIAALSGSLEEQDRAERGRDAAIDAILGRVRSALRVRDYSGALRGTQQALTLQPDSSEADRLRRQARAGLMAGRLTAALEAGDIARAEEVFDEIREQQWSPAARRQFNTPITLLGEYYAATLYDLLETRQYERAYRGLRNLRALDAWLERDFDRVLLESEFAELMYELAASAGAQGLSGVEYGFLLLVEEFEPAFVNLERLKRETGERLLEAAVQWVSTPAIRGDDQTRNVGSRISSSVAAYLLENIPTDLRIVEREQLEEIQRERRMTEAETQGSRARDAALRAADLLIQGNVLDVRVDREDRTGRRTMRVVTGTRQVPNPAYEAYRAERGGQPDGEDAPPKTIPEEIEEDITTEVSIHRKTGSVAVSYRVVEAESANVLLTNTINREREFTDESSEGIEMGEFSQPFKLPNLPSDGEIINELVDEVALALGEELMEILSNPEKRYLSNCERFALEENFVAAAEECARAVILVENKGTAEGEAHDRLRRMTLNSGIRPD
jgi:curli biogenesis system outer membrane secretion channel CsgG